jgi:hypothetical protein
MEKYYEVSKYMASSSSSEKLTLYDLRDDISKAASIVSSFTDINISYSFTSDNVMILSLVDYTKGERKNPILASFVDWLHLLMEVNHIPREYLKIIN